LLGKACKSCVWHMITALQVTAHVPHLVVVMNAAAMPAQAVAMCVCVTVDEAVIMGTSLHNTVDRAAIPPKHAHVHSCTAIHTHHTHDNRCKATDAAILLTVSCCTSRRDNLLANKQASSQSPSPTSTANMTTLMYQHYSQYTPVQHEDAQHAAALCCGCHTAGHTL
jgi:hypothetical protein